jgi:ribosome-associated toxin RatA of RatAB toxin-antitoxin module
VPQTARQSQWMRLFQQFGKSTLILSVLMGLFVLTAGSSAWSKEIPNWDALSKGQVVIQQNAGESKGAVPSVEARILVSKPMNKVWSVVSEPETLMKSDPRVKKVKVLSRSGNKQNVEFNVMMTRLFPTFNYVLVQELSAPNTVRFHRLSGSFRDIQGSWKLLPGESANQTILSYTLMLDPGPLIPRSLLLGAVKSDLPNMMHHAKASIDKNAP